MSVQVTYKKQFIFAFLAILIALMGIEVIAQFYSVYHSNNCQLVKSDTYEKLGKNVKIQICNDLEDLVYVHDPFLSIEPNQHSKTININNEGFRGPEIVKNKPSNTYRIFILGGSTAFGSTSTSDETTISGYLQKKINKFGNSNFKIEVINAGVPAAWSHVETLYIKQKLLEYSPDLFMIYDGWNDVYKNEQDWLKAKNEIEYYEDGKKTFIDSVYFSMRTDFSFYKTPLMLRNISNTFFTAYQPDQIKAYEKHLPEMAKDWEERWTNICELGENQNFKTIIILQPLVGTGNRELSDQDQLWFDNRNHFDLVNAYQSFADKLVNLEHHCTKTADLRNIFDHVDEQIYTDAGHVVDSGNEILAEHFYQLLLPIIIEE